jgi:hypothetical protein
MPIVETNIKLVAGSGTASQLPVVLRERAFVAPWIVLLAFCVVFGSTALDRFWRDGLVWLAQEAKGYDHSPFDYLAEVLLSTSIANPYSARAPCNRALLGIRFVCPGMLVIAVAHPFTTSISKWPSARVTD